MPGNGEQSQPVVSHSQLEYHKDRAVSLLKKSAGEVVLGRAQVQTVHGQPFV